MKIALTLILATLASPAFAHGDTPFHPESPTFLLAGLMVIAVVALVALRRRRSDQ